MDTATVALIGVAVSLLLNAAGWVFGTGRLSAKVDTISQRLEQVLEALGMGESDARFVSVRDFRRELDEVKRDVAELRSRR